MTGSSSTRASRARMRWPMSASSSPGQAAGSPWRAQRKPRKPQCSGLVAPRPGSEEWSRACTRWSAASASASSSQAPARSCWSWLSGFSRNVLARRNRPWRVSNSTVTRGAREVPAGCRALISSLRVVHRSKSARAQAWTTVDLPASLGAASTLSPGPNGPRRTAVRNRPTCVSSSAWRITGKPPADVGTPSGGVARTTPA
jgi:hypothetical protein